MEQSAGLAFNLSRQQRQLLETLAEAETSWAEMEVRPSAPSDPARIDAAIATVTGRHEALRTTFERRAGVRYPFQVVSAAPALQSQIRPDGSFVLRAPLLSVDERSLELIAQEILALAAAEAAAPSEPLQYADYCEWQRSRGESGDPEAAAATFWTRFEQAAPATLPFVSAGEAEPAGHARGAASEAVQPLTGDWAARLEQNGISLAGALLAGWHEVLGRYQREPEFVIGYVHSGRDYEELEKAIGNFASVLPVGLHAESGQSFREAAWAAQAAIEAAAGFADFAPAPSRTMPEGAGFSYEQAPAGSAGYTIERLNVPARFLVHLRCRLEAGQLRAAIDFDPTRVPALFAGELAGGLAALLRAGVSRPDDPLSQLPAMPDALRDRVVRQWNQTQADFDDACLHTLFERQADQNPSLPALRGGDACWNYAELNCRANQLAHLLRKHGVQANIPVALCMERSAEMIIALLGIFKAGGCYVPLVPDHPQDRLLHQLRETGAAVLVTSEGLLERCPAFAGATICLDRDARLLAAEPDHNPKFVNTPDDLAYIIYTSGSTGVPKGVSVAHRSLTNYSQFMMRRMEQAAGTRLSFATVSTISADLGNTAIFPALISGGYLHVIDYETALSAGAFSRYAAGHAIDVLKITPSHLSALLTQAGGDAVLPKRLLITGGETLTWPLLERVLAAGRCKVLNHYGPTEATIGCCTFATWEEDVRRWNPATVPIGKPIANAQLYILNEALEAVPPGAPGEICIGGAGLARGYYRQPAQTEEKFVHHPSFSASLLYRTGDLGRFLPDGNIEFLGRIDQQVKIRGFRVELREIEVALEQHASVREAAVFCDTSPQDEPELFACITTADADTRASEVQEFLRKSLPEYMIPHVHVVERLPLTPNGKLDVKQLRAHIAESAVDAHQGEQGAAPRDEVEQQVAAIWSEVLKKPCADVMANFFRIGGHSLLATQIVARVRDTFLVQVPLHRFMERATIADLAQLVRESPATAAEEPDMAKLLQELESLSDEEAEALLAEEMRKQEARPDPGARRSVRE